MWQNDVYGIVNFIDMYMQNKHKGRVLYWRTSWEQLTLLNLCKIRINFVRMKKKRRKIKAQNDNSNQSLSFKKFLQAVKTVDILELDLVRISMESK